MTPSILPTRYANLLIRQVLVALQNQDLEHQHHIMAGAAAGPFGLLLKSTLQIRPEHPPIDPGVQTSQRIGAFTQLLHAVFVVE